MAQLVVSQNHQGIILATDSKALEFDGTGNLTEMKVDRLFQLGPHAAIVAGGGAAGAQMCVALRKFIDDEGLTDIQDIYTAALPLLGTEFARYLREKCQSPHLDPLLHVYFILAGYTAHDAERPTRIYFIWTKKKLPQLDGDEIRAAYTVPRRMGLEYNLNRLVREDAPQSDVLRLIQENMERLGRDQEEVGPPFAYATITKDGFRRIS